MDKFVTAVGAFVIVAILATIFGLTLSLPVMWLWNGCLIDAVDGLHKIGWLQAWGISILCSILFKSEMSKKD